MMLSTQVVSALSLLVRLIWLGILSSIPLVRGSPSQVPIFSNSKPLTSTSESELPPVLCALWSTNPSLPGYEGRLAAKFEIPLEKLEKLFLFSAGNMGGSMRVEYLGFESESVQIYVVAKDARKGKKGGEVGEGGEEKGSSLSNASLCQIEGKTEKEVGVGFFVPNFVAQEMFDMIVYLPRPSHGGLLYLKEFTTDLPNFSQSVEDLSDNVEFGSISLRGDVHPVKIQSLRADRLQIQTRAGPITGTFHVTTSLALRTEVGHIKVDVHLLNNPFVRNPTEVLMSTNHGPIEARLNLQSTHKSGGSFRVVSSTDRSPINLNLLSLPLDSTLSLSGSTTSAPCLIRLPSSYEGDFLLRSTVKRPEVYWNVKERDPAGRGRVRDVRVSVADTFVTGKVSWGGRGAGRVDVETTQARVTLQL